MDALLAAVQKFPCVRACVRRRKQRMALCVRGGIPSKQQLPLWTNVASALYEKNLAATFVLQWPVVASRIHGQSFVSDIARCIALAGHSVAVDVSALGWCDDATLRRVLLEVVQDVLSTLGQTVEWASVAPCNERTARRVLPALGLRLLPATSDDIFALSWENEHAPRELRAAVGAGVELVTVEAFFDSITE